DRLRDLAMWANPERLRELSREPVPESVSAAMVVVLGELLDARGIDPAPVLLVAHARAPGEFRLAFALGLWYLKRDARQAIGYFRAAQALRPDNVAIALNLGYCHNQLKEYDTALVALDGAVRLDPNFAMAHSNRGHALESRGELDAAVAAYNEALR